MATAKIVGVVYNSRNSRAEEMATYLVDHISDLCETWMCPALDITSMQDMCRRSSFLVTVGGDGTILRTARVAAPYDIPLLGVNLGRVGFMAELLPEEAVTCVRDHLGGNSLWTEERLMLQALRCPFDSGGNDEPQIPIFALNDVVVGRGAVSRLVSVETYLDGVYFNTFRADAVIVSTPTGSTAYSLSAGGPVLYPQADDILLKGVAPHLGFSGGLVMAASTVVELVIRTDHPGMLSVDGYTDIALQDGDVVRVDRSPHRVKFLRAHPPEHFYATLRRRLLLGNDE